MPYHGGSFGPNHSHHGGDGDHHHHRAVYWHGGVYPWYPWMYTGPIFTGYVDPWLFAPDDYGYDQGGYYGGDAPAPYRDYGYEPNPAWPYGAQDAAPVDEQPAGTVAQGAPLRQSTITLIFNDGRPPEQVHNFLLTGSTLTVLDAQYREIPLKEVNVAATESANRAAGVEFRVPAKQ